MALVFTHAELKRSCKWCPGLGEGHGGNRDPRPRSFRLHQTSHVRHHRGTMWGHGAWGQPPPPRGHRDTGHPRGSGRGSGADETPVGEPQLLVPLPVPIPNCWATEKAGEGGTSSPLPGTGSAGSVATTHPVPWAGRGPTWLWHDACPLQVTPRTPVCQESRDSGVALCPLPHAGFWHPTAPSPPAMPARHAGQDPGSCEAESHPQPAPGSHRAGSPGLSAARLLPEPGTASPGGPGTLPAGSIAGGRSIAPRPRHSRTRASPPKNPRKPSAA